MSCKVYNKYASIQNKCEKATKKIIPLNSCEPKGILYFVQINCAPNVLSSRIKSDTKLFLPYASFYVIMAQNMKERFCLNNKYF